jgi:hypothetical protein
VANFDQRAPAARPVVEAQLRTHGHATHARAKSSQTTPHATATCDAEAR